MRHFKEKCLGLGNEGVESVKVLAKHGDILEDTAVGERRGSCRNMRNCVWVCSLSADAGGSHQKLPGKGQRKKTEGRQSGWRESVGSSHETRYTSHGLKKQEQPRG